MEDLDAASSLPAMADPDPALLEAAMQVPVTVWLGPVGPLLRKLNLGQSLPPDLLSEDEIRLLTDLCISLKDMAEDDDASFMIQWWMKMVRELCYDTEDHLDQVIDGGGPGSHHDFPARAKNVLSGLLARAEDARKRHRRLQLSPLRTIKPADRGEASASRLTSPELPVPICGRSTGCIVGLHVDLPEQLVELLALDNEKTLKVIPITGCAGVGKTTVARSLYRKHGRKFQCRAFVTVSRNPHMRGFLTSMLSELKAPWLHGFPDVPDLIHAISKHLQGKRYFIVIDDLWTASVWNIISRAFPLGDSCSRIITTTQIDDVALACCAYYPVYIYKMEPLNDYKSLELFFGIKEIPNVKKEKWLREDKQYSEQMKDVLIIIYSSLPPRLRTCLLYLSMYAHGYVIKKDELLMLWAVEGFLYAVGEQGPEEIAQGYFDELVSRGMVQAVDTTYNGEVLSCSVHQIVLDFIRYKSREENFVITLDYDQSTLALPEKVHRLSAQFGGVKSAHIPESIVTSNVRSVIFWGFFKCLPSSFMDYGLLSILILHIWADEDNESLDLTGIGELFLLKHLEIECNITIKLPDMIRWLQRLETLKVHAKVVAFPSDIGLLERLLHLRLLSQYIQNSVVAHMTSLCTLGYFDVGSHSEENILHLGRLKNLQDLQLTCTTVQPAENLERNIQLLGSILAELTVLQSLTLVPAASGSYCVNIPEDGFNMVSPPPNLLLQKIELSRHCCIFFSLPKWFGELRKLCILRIALRQLSGEDIDILKELCSLASLTLYIQTAPAETICINMEGFNVLTYLKFMCATPCLSFLPGAMPKVQKLELGYNSNEWRSHTFETVGFHHLASLTEVSVKLGVGHADNFKIKGMDSALKDAIKYHLNTTILTRVQLVDVIYYGTTSTNRREKKLQEIREGKKKMTEHLDEQDEIRQDVHIDNKWVTEISEVQEENRPKIIVMEMMTEISEVQEENHPKIIVMEMMTEISEVQEEKPMEIQEDKKEITKRSEEHVNKQDNSRYVRTDRGSTRLKNHIQPVNVVTGTMGSLLPKLLKLKDKYMLMLQTDVKNRVESLHKELEALQAALWEVAKLEQVQLDDVARIWAKEVRDFSYDAEDVVDYLPGSAEGRKARHEIATAINGMMKQAQYLADDLENTVGVHIATNRNAAGSLLDGKPMNDWSKVYSNIGFGSEVGNNARKILLLSTYYDMPYHLRACLLHLHIFPEDCLIEKQTLIWKWAAEGLIVEETGTGLFELGERYFQELININLVLPVEDDSHPGKVIGCHVHDLVHDMICSLSTQENFVTVLDGSKQQTPVECKARRLAVQDRAAEQGDRLAHIDPRRLRSFNTMGCRFSTELTLSRCKLLRVLALEECSLVEGNLSHVGKLLLLRYLGLYNTPIKELPEEVGDLKYLQTLDLRGTKVTELPWGVVMLSQLKCLRADKYTAVPAWRWYLQSLEELRLGDIDTSEYFVDNLGTLTELRELEIWIERLGESQKEALMQSMRILEKIQVLRLMGRPSLRLSNELSWRDYDPPRQLREFCLGTASPRLPAWINVSRVPMLSYLSVCVEAVGEKDLDILGALPELINLKLLLLPWVDSPTIKGGGAFPKLRSFHTTSIFKFLLGAMPRLESLHFEINKSSARPVESALENLLSIQKVEAKIRDTADLTKVEPVKRAVDKHPNSPSFHVVKTDELSWHM